MAKINYATACGNCREFQRKIGIDGHCTYHNERVDSLMVCDKFIALDTVIGLQDLKNKQEA